MSDSLKDGNALSRSSLLDKIANPTLVNPLAAQANALQVARGVWANRQDQANQALGEAYQGAIDEQGRFDPSKFNRNLVAAGPGASLAAQSGVESSQKLAGSQIDQAANVRRVISNELGPVLTLPDAQLGQGIAAAAARLRAGGVPEPLIHQTLLNMPNSPDGQRQYLNQLRLQLAGPEQNQQNIPGYGTTGTVTGKNGQLTGYVQAPTGQVTAPPQQGAQQGLSPEAASARTVVGYDKVTGQPIYGPAINVAPPQYGGPVGPGRLPPALQGPGGAPAAQPPAGTPPAGTPPAAKPAADPSVVAAPDPRVAEQNKADQEQFLTDQKGIPTRQTGVQSLINAQHALELTTTGSKTEAVHAIKSFLSAQGVSTAGMDESVENYDKFRKAAIDYARQQASGAGTNLQLEAAEHANANPEMVNAANRSVIQTNVGRERQAIAATLASPDQKLGAGHIAHKSDFANTTDPRGFAVDRYTPDELKKMVAAMTDTEKAKFYKSVGIGRRFNLLNPTQ